MNSVLVSAFDWILRSTWQASCLAVLVLGVQYFLGRRLSARARCILWFVVIARLLLPPLPVVRWTLLHARAPVAPPVTVADRPHVMPVLENVLVDPAPVVPTIVTPKIIHIDPKRVAELRSELAAMRDVTPLAPPALSSAPPVAASIVPVRSLPKPIWPRIRPLLPIVWLVGAALLLARMLIATWQLSRTISRLPRLDDPTAVRLLQSCGREMNLRRLPELRVADHLSGPALAGWIRPKLFVPPSVLVAFRAADLRLMFLHELAHVRRRDVPLNWILSTFAALHWFNPVLWFSFRRMRVDRELACDSLVIATTQAHPDAGRQYGHTLLRLADWLARRSEPRRAPMLAAAGLVEILEDSRELQRRIIMISRFNPALRPWPAIAAAGVLLLAGLAITDAAEPASAPRAAVEIPQKARPATQPAEVAATTRPRPLLSTDYLDANQKAQIDALTSRLKFVDLQYRDGITDVLAVFSAKIDIAKARIEACDAKIKELSAAGQMTERHPQIIALQNEQIRQMEQLAELREEVVKVEKSMFDAGLKSATEDQVHAAEAAAAQARRELADVQKRFSSEASTPKEEVADGTKKLLDARLNQAKVENRVAHANYDRIKAMHEQKATSDQELDHAEAEVAKADADLAAAQLKMQHVGPPARGGGAGPASAEANTVQDSDAERLDAEAAAKLNQPITGLSEPSNLKVLVHELGKSTGLNFIVDHRALESAGIAEDGNIHLSLNAPASASQILKWALRSLGNGAQLGYTIDHGGVLISTADQLQAMVVTRVYDVADLTPQQNGEDLPTLIREVIDPNGWRDNGAQYATVRQFRDKLLVTQTQPNHMEVARLLMLLRSKAAANVIAPPVVRVPDVTVDEAARLAELRNRYGENHPLITEAKQQIAAREAATSDNLRKQTIERMREMMVAVRLYNQERGGMPKGFHIVELANMLNFPANETPRLPFLRYGYRWVAPEDVLHLEDIKDPEHTPIFSEVVPQPDGTELVAYADGHVAEASREQIKALATVLDRGNREAVAEVHFPNGLTMSVPRAIVAECQQIADSYDVKRRVMADESGKAVTQQEVLKALGEEIDSKVKAWTKRQASR